MEVGNKAGSSDPVVLGPDLVVWVGIVGVVVVQVEAAVVVAVVVAAAAADDDDDVVAVVVVVARSWVDPNDRRHLNQNLRNANFKNGKKNISDICTYHEVAASDAVDQLLEVADV